MCLFLYLGASQLASTQVFKYLLDRIESGGLKVIPLSLFSIAFGPFPPPLSSRGVWAAGQMHLAWHPGFLGPATPRGLSGAQGRTEGQFSLPFQPAADKNVLRARSQLGLPGHTGSFCVHPPHILEAPVGMWPEFKHLGP